MRFLKVIMLVWIAALLIVFAIEAAIGQTTENTPSTAALEFANLSIFVLWITTTMWLAADSRIPAFNREFTGLIFATACLFYGLITAELWSMAFLAYLGIRTFQKAKNGGGTVANNTQ